MKLSTRDITEIALFTALISVTSLISFPVGDVPITLQTLMVMLIGLLLKPRNSVLVIAAYLIIGSIGVPVFAGAKGGFGVIVGPTGGFLISFIFAVLFISKMKNVKIINNKLMDIFIILVFANLIIYMIGWTYFAIYMNFDILRTLGVMSLFIVADLMKIMIGTYVYLNMHSYVTYERALI